MSSVITYKGYIGSVEISEEDGILFGKVQGIRSLISYEGETVRELVRDFHAAVDDYLTACKDSGTEPEVAYKGTLNVRLKPETHKRAAVYAMTHEKSLNSFIEEAVRDKLTSVV